MAMSTNAFLGNESPQLAVPDMALHSMKSTETLATNQGKSVIKSTVLGETAAIKFFGVMDTGTPLLPVGSPSDSITPAACGLPFI